MQIDSGMYGVVWGVNRLHMIYCRYGITWKKPEGTKWIRVPGKLKYVSGGEFGIWGVTKGGYIFFRYGSRWKKPQG